MEQFSLEKYLENQQRKVVTRDGRPVRIICTDRKERSGNIVGLVGEEESLIYVWNNDGKHIVSEIPDNDLFFADEEDDLTEFETTMVSFAHAMFDHLLDVTKEVNVKEWKDKLIDLARKELERQVNEEGVTQYDAMTFNNGYRKGYEDALKDLPKWKKANEYKEFEINEACGLDDDIYPIIVTNVNKGEYYLELDELRNLPLEK